MAEQKQQQEKQKPKAPVAEKKHNPREEEDHEVLVRIFGYDVPGSKNVFVGLTRVKGVSWAVSNAVCIKLKMPHSKKISELSKDDIVKIEKFMRTIDLPHYMKNRRFDPESGETSHLYGSDLDIAREFDIKREKKMKSYRGFRHTYGQPSRGQRTKSHFRKKGQGTGIKKKAGSSTAKPEAKK